MKTTKLGRYGVLFLVLALVLNSLTIPVFAASGLDVLSSAPEGAKLISAQSHTHLISLWHYSGGYWARDASDPLKIYDSQVGENVERLEELMGETVDFSFYLPEPVTNAIAAGKKIAVTVTHDPSKDYFVAGKGMSTTIDGSFIRISAYPKFHLIDISRYSYDDFVSDLYKRIPFVDPKYGENAYSIFNNSGSNLGACAGYFDPSDPMKLGPAGTIHPSQIADSTGRLQSGTTVAIHGTPDVYDASDVKIGDGTFAHAGAVAMRFYYDITVTYYELDDHDVAVTGISPTEFSAGQSANVYVTVQNQGTKAVTGPVTFQANGISGRQDVTLEAGESKTLSFSLTAPASGTFPMTAEINPERSFTETDYENNIMTVTGRVKTDNDVAVTQILQTAYPATSVVTADVSVKNQGSDDVVSSVDFSVPGLTTQTKFIELAAGQTQVVHFTFSTPETGPIQMTAEANKARSFYETDYENNLLTVLASIIPVPAASESCGDVISWTETDSHIVSGSIWSPLASTWIPYSYTCTHTLTYETKLSVEYDISPKTLKSGYGFAVTVNNSISTRMTNNTGCGDWGNGRANSKIPVPPGQVQLKLPWAVHNSRGTQPSTVSLNLLSRTETKTSFVPKVNPISETGAKLIYTDVALAGTKAGPEQHQFIISITGGGVNGIPFCKEIMDYITINGNLYEDDHSGSAG